MHKAALLRRRESVKIFSNIHSSKVYKQNWWQMLVIAISWLLNFKSAKPIKHNKSYYNVIYLIVKLGTFLNINMSIIIYLFIYSIFKRLCSK